METTKKVRGSAMSLSDGSFIFNPYVQLPPTARTMKLVKSTPHATLWMGKHKASIRMSFDRNSLPPFDVWISEITHMYQTLLETNLHEF